MSKDSKQSVNNMQVCPLVKAGVASLAGDAAKVYFGGGVQGTLAKGAVVFAVSQYDCSRHDSTVEDALKLAGNSCNDHGGWKIGEYKG